MHLSGSGDVPGPPIYVSRTTEIHPVVWC